MKVIHVLQNFPPQFRGGIEVYVQGLCRLQKERGLDPVVLAGSEKRKWCDDLVEEAGEPFRVFRFYRTPQGEDFSVDFYLERFERLFLNFLEKEKPDLAHVHHWLNLGNEVSRIANDAGVPVVLTLHDLYPLCPRFFMTTPEGAACGPEAVPVAQCLTCTTPDYQGTHDRLEGEFRIRADSFRDEFAAVRRVIVPSISHSLPYLKAGLLKEGEFTVLHHGLVRDVPKPVWVLNREGPLRVVTWGNLVRSKGVLILLAALKEAANEVGRRIELHLFGQPVDRDFGLELECAAQGLEVVFHGDFSNLSATEVARGMDLAVFPSLARESYSMVLDEAVASGLPVVVSDAGALPERVGAGGIIVKAGDVSALARVLVELEQDRSRLETLSGAIQKQAWTLKDNHRELEAIYREVVREGAAPVTGGARLRRTALLKGELLSLRLEKAKRDGEFLTFTRFRDFVPLRDFSLLPGGAVLILAPHPDDEVIGCGGVAALHAERGDDVTVLHLTDGSGSGSIDDLSEVRKRESIRSGEVLGIRHFLALDRKDGRLTPDEQTVSEVVEVIERLKPGIVYAPSPFEIHTDHVAALFLALHALEKASAHFGLFLYEVNEAMVPGLLIDISRVIEKKDRALAFFESQIGLNNVREKSVAGARWRTANVDLPQVTHAEAFIEAQRENLRGLIARTKEVVEFIGRGSGGHG
ncbi:MAG: PIG-L family deacetylase [Planctomycetota bacterium]